MAKQTYFSWILTGGVIGWIAYALGRFFMGHFWMKAFAFGPMEWLWRALTYGRVPAMRRDPVVAA